MHVELLLCAATYALMRFESKNFELGMSLPVYFSIKVIRLKIEN